MAAGPPDLVDCAQLAEDAAVLERVYEMRDLERLKDVLTDTRGVVQARFAFSSTFSGRPGAKIEIRAEPKLRCQRCMQGFTLAVSGGSEIEFAEEEAADASDPRHEPYWAVGGKVSLRDLAEEELLLALPIVPACDEPESCCNAPSLAADAERAESSGAMRRPFGGLKDLLKKT
ncbi:MAG: YceD family protein [Steroidobacteraceae bacterium]|jgi:uncharacterized protein